MYATRKTILFVQYVSKKRVTPEIQYNTIYMIQQAKRRVHMCQETLILNCLIFLCTLETFPIVRFAVAIIVVVTIRWYIYMCMYVCVCVCISSIRARAKIFPPLELQACRT